MDKTMLRDWARFNGALLIMLASMNMNSWMIADAHRGPGEASLALVKSVQRGSSKTEHSPPVQKRWLVWSMAQ